MLDFLAIEVFVYKWCESYITNICKCVNIKERVSIPSPVKIAVPQGPILSPLPFVLYQNDIRNAMDNIKLF